MFVFVLNFREKSYDRLNFSTASLVQFQASWYIIGLNQTSESKVMVVWICPGLLCLFSSILIYNVPELDIRVKSYDHLNFSRSSIVQFQASRYIIGLNRTSKSKVTAIWICHEFPCSISTISNMMLLNQTSEWKVITIWICRELPLFNFKPLDILLALIIHLSQKLWLFVIALHFHV